MKFVQKRWIALVLALMMLLSVLPVSAKQPERTAEILSVGSGYAVDPFSKEVPDSSVLPEPEEPAAPQGTVTYCQTIAQAAKLLREQMKRRVTRVTISIEQPELDSELPRQILQEAMSHTGDPAEGDYLAWQRGGVSWSWSGSGSPDGKMRMDIEYTLIYYTDSLQETKMDAAVKTLLDDLNLYQASDYEKIRGIYDWMCTHITYDYANLNNESYNLKYTAYAALVNRTAVCQGYALLFYRLALELGVDARLVTGLGNGGGHAWNIVKLGGWYYNLDATWDTPRGPGRYDYFLKNMGDFSDHARDKEYKTKEFLAAYPMSLYSYEPGVTRIPFTDVPETEWYREPVEFVYRERLMLGVSADSFAPTRQITRGELVTILYRMYGAPQVTGKLPFRDVNPKEYYADPILWAYQNEIAKGTGNDCFSPDVSVSRQDMVCFFARFARFIGRDMTASADLTGFRDYGQIQPYAREAMGWAAANRIIQGVGNNRLAPEDTADRSQAAALIQRLSCMK